MITPEARRYLRFRPVIRVMLGVLTIVIRETADPDVINVRRQYDPELPPLVVAFSTGRGVLWGLRCIDVFDDTWWLDRGPMWTRRFLVTVGP